VVVKQYIPFTTDEFWRFVTVQKVMSLATVSRNGTPHNTAVWYVVDGSKIYFRAQSYKKKIKNIRTNDLVSCLIHTGARYSELRGTSILARARVVSNERERRRLSRLIHQRYLNYRDYDRFPAHWRKRFLAEERSVVELTPLKIMSWDNRKWAKDLHD
jgi:PPOX class probable F420-dependent enzyme